MRFRLIVIGFLVAVLGGWSAVFAAGGELKMEALWFSKENVLEGATVTIYARVKNLSEADLNGTVQFFDGANGRQIGDDRPFSVFVGSEAGVFVTWKPAFGEHQVLAKLTTWEGGDDTANNTLTVNYYVDRDADGDGVGNRLDADDDNDGVLDSVDEFPFNSKEAYDTDKDGVGNNADEDDDNDGFMDVEDAFPLDKKEHSDTDGDGIGNVADGDDDGDGLTDVDEEVKGTDPLVADTDGDSTKDGEDEFPLDPKLTRDTDKDGVDNSVDEDDDQDGVLDAEDKFPLNPEESQDTDGDGVGNNADEDDDGDGLTDAEEEMRGTDIELADTDGDGVNDKEDVFPRDVAEWNDQDQDGLGDNADENDTNKGPVVLLKHLEKAKTDEIVIFDASESYDPDGEIAKFVFTFSDGKVLEGERVERVFTEAGSYEVVFEVTDNAGEKRSEKFVFEVENKYYTLLFLVSLAGVLTLLYLAWAFRGGDEQKNINAVLKKGRRKIFKRRGKK